MLSLNQILIKLEEIQTEHAQLNDFYFGHPADAEDSGALRYGLMIVQLEDGSLAKRINTTKLNIAICAKVFADESNKAEVLSDTQLIALDVYAQLYEYLDANDIELTPDVPFNPLQAVWDTSVWGWEMVITINQFYSRDTCQVPTKN